MELDLQPNWSKDNTDSPHLLTALFNNHSKLSRYEKKILLAEAVLLDIVFPFRPVSQTAGKGVCR